jgi:hypothetical protein
MATITGRSFGLLSQLAQATAQQTIIGLKLNPRRRVYVEIPKP